ncbi:MAG: GNAT family N-acetyltransferase [Candidatus Eremiobacteraeota bacterium]|nr:GNAT family N-acetyltransferase [Candidatus Eremiobacteraeota bacterium]MBV8367169.1 GNAT family N-acetyltransferase [Candidatus Eremiobacteraeota bacterium]
MNQAQRPAFIGERITPQTGSADVAAMSHGEPGLPRAFHWRGHRFEVARRLGSRRDLGQDRGDVYVRRHVHEFETTDGLRMSVYFERNPRDRSRSKAWWLYTIAFPTPVITTQRLWLRRWTYADRADFTRMVSDAETMRFLHDGIPLSTRQADEALDATIAHYELGYGDWAIVARDDGAILGESGLTRLRESGEVELGYMLRSAFWGRGFASEAASAIVRYAFDELELGRLVSLIEPANAASVRIVERLGMRPLGATQHRGRRMLKYELLAPSERAGGV